MKVSLAGKIIGWILVIAMAVGFESENGWLFLIAAILSLGWLAWVLITVRAAHSQHRSEE